jgi:hypothetical protein
LTLPAATDTLVGKTTTDTLINKTLTAPTLASANIITALTLTGASGTNGQALTSGGSGNAPTWTTIGATPGGSTTQVQYNNAGAFGGISGVTTDGTRMTASTTIGVGAATPSTSGSGITFPATQSASSNANTLDDYEEGTWTPNQGSGLTVVGTFSSSGSYTKIGRVVTIIATVKSTTSITTSGFGTVCSNLPFSSVAGGEAYGTGTAYNNSATATSVTQAVGLELATFTAFSATTAIHFTNVYTSAT